MGQFETHLMIPKSLLIAEIVTGGHLTNLIFETTVDREEDMIARILTALETIEYIPRIFKRVFFFIKGKAPNL